MTNAGLMLGQQFYRELAFHIAGELIMQGVERMDADADLDVTIN